MPPEPARPSQNAVKTKSNFGEYPSETVWKIAIGLASVLPRRQKRPIGALSALFAASGTPISGYTPTFQTVSPCTPLDRRTRRRPFHSDAVGGDEATVAASSASRL